MQPDDDSTGADPDVPSSVHLARESWSAAALKVEPVQSGTLERSIKLTGKVTLNEDRVAHIFPLVEGRVDEVKIQFGDKVKRGDLLVVVQSKEVGQAKLRLYQDRLARDFAVTKDRWTQEATANAQTMLRLMRDETPIEKIEQELKNRPVGEYRDRLMSAYIGRYRSRKQMERLSPLAGDGAVTGKQLLEAEAELNATGAALQSIVEQIQHDTQQAAAVSAQAVKELQTRVAVEETELRILGFQADDLTDLDPTVQGVAVSHYPVRAPLDGTVLSKDVVLLERVGPDRQILSIADLSTVWVTADIYEEQLPLLDRLEGRVVRVAGKSRPDETFEARIFYSGDVVDEASRTISMRAIADNREGKLKPGMFVSVDIPASSERPMVRVPLSAVQEHGGKSFVFVYSKDDLFERRDVTLGSRNTELVEVRTGLRRDEQVVTSGGFFLKSRMLASLLEE